MPSTKKSLVVLTLALAGAACRDRGVRIYSVAKEQPAASAASGLPSAGPAPAASGLRWTAPARWRQLPASELRLASYRIPGRGQSEADFSIIAFPGDAGGEPANLNRWRGQLGLAPAEAKDMDVKTVQTPAGPARMVDFAGAAAAGGRTRLLGAILRTEDRSWFFKLMGEDETVSAARGEFIALLKGLKRG